LYCIHRVWISGDWLIWKPYICMFQVKSLQIQDVSAAIAHYDHELHKVRLYHFFLNMVALWRSLVSEIWAYEVMSVICACHAWLHPLSHIQLLFILETWTLTRCLSTEKSAQWFQFVIKSWALYHTGESFTRGREGSASDWSGMLSAAFNMTSKVATFLCSL